MNLYLTKSGDPVVCYCCSERILKGEYELINGKYLCLKCKNKVVYMPNITKNN